LCLLLHLSQDLRPRRYTAAAACLWVLLGLLQCQQLLLHGQQLLAHAYYLWSFRQQQLLLTLTLIMLLLQWQRTHWCLLLRL
jgi:hypothetical protein